MQHNTAYVVGCTFPLDAGPVGGAVAGWGGDCTSLPRTVQVMRQGLVGAAVGGRWGSRGRFEAVRLGSGGKDEFGRPVVGPRGC